MRTWCKPALCITVHAAPGAAIVIFVAVCFFLWQGCFYSLIQPGLLLHLHSQWERFASAEQQCSSTHRAPGVDTLWLSAQRTALTKSLVTVHLRSRDNGILKIGGVGWEFTWLLNRMAGLGCDTVSSEMHFKIEPFFLYKLVCLQTQTLYQLARSTANMCLSVAKGHPYTEVTIWFVNHGHGVRVGLPLQLWWELQDAFLWTQSQLWAEETSLCICACFSRNKQKFTSRTKKGTSYYSKSTWANCFCCTESSVASVTITHMNEMLRAWKGGSTAGRKNKSSKGNVRCSQNRVLSPFLYRSGQSEVNSAWGVRMYPWEI